MHRRLPFVLLPWLAATLPAANSRAEGPGNIDIQQYQPPPFYHRYLRADAPDVLPAWKSHFALDLDYAYKPLVLTDVAPSIQTMRKTTYDLVRHAVGADLAASIGLFGRLELGAALPIVLYQTGETTPGTDGPGLLGVGNPRIGLKGRILNDARRGLGLGASLVVSIPTGIGGALIRETSLGGEGRLFGSLSRPRWNVALDAGFRVRAADHLYDIPVGNQLTFAAAAEVRLSSATRALLELAGATAAGSPFGSAKESPTEALVGLRREIGHVELTLAGGPGLVSGFGSPTARAVFAIAWSDAPHDADQDGIPDEADKCPNEPEDKDGFEDSDGCPDPDNDKDGILDRDDKCPNDPEDKDGFEDSDGCPDPDNDKDGIPDDKDKCPNQPETVNGFQDDDGCPDEVPPPSDRDKDGINDDADECPDEPEDKDGFEDEDGCPDPDNDKDGIPDEKDKCPNEPETINGFQDDDGCPDKGPAAAVKIGPDELETLKPVFFDTDRARVRHAFYNILGQIALTLKAHPEIGRCAVEGHTDDTGPEEWNQKLSQLRAQSVVEFLVKKGVERERLAAIGHGEKLPWTSNETPWGRAKNRRVIFHIEGVNLEDQEKQERRRLVREQKAAERRAREEGEQTEPREREKNQPRQREPREPRQREPREPRERDQREPREEKAPPPRSPARAPDPGARKPGGDEPAPADKAPEAKPPTSAGRTSVPAQSTDRPKAKPGAAENPRSLRDLLKLPPGEGLDETAPAGDGAPDLPKRRPKP
ncbi:MAG TPA: OmpA family protein [Polyangia bacterium]|nr:OmpA family protein [Polyangia bacterium]